MRLTTLTGRHPISPLLIHAVIACCVFICTGCVSTERLPDDEQSHITILRQSHWLVGTVELVNDPLRTHAWEIQPPGVPAALCLYGFKARDTIDVNRLILRLADIPAEGLILWLGMPDCRELRHLRLAERFPVVFGMNSRYAPSFKPLSPSMFVDPTHPGIDLNKLEIPVHVIVKRGPVFSGKGIRADDAFLRTIDVFVAEHGTKRADVPKIPPALQVACPEWIKAPSPRWARHWLGKFGLPERCRAKFSGPIAPTVSGIDYWQANHFIVFRKETAEFLYNEYTPLEVDYVKGTLPDFEAVVAKYTSGLTSDREKAVSLLTRALPEILRHPEMPPFGPPCRPDRGVDDAKLLASGKGWCNEQARVFVRLCQVAGIPARLIFLWYQNCSGHVIAEFYADGRWCMADASWFCVFPGPADLLLSARQCHGRFRELANRLYEKRIADVLSLPNEKLVGGRFADVSDPQERNRLIRETAKEARKKFRPLTNPKRKGNNLRRFGVLNYPLPAVSR